MVILLREPHKIAHNIKRTQSLISLNLITKNHTHICSFGITDVPTGKGNNSKTFIQNKTNQGSIVASKLSSQTEKYHWLSQVLLLNN